MSILKKRYESLTPNSESLADEVVLAQAWKKTHSYIRRHNWYADILELDASAFSLDRHLNKWTEAISDDDFKPSPLKLVPAPKNARWEFRKKLESDAPLKSMLDASLDELSPEPSFADWQARRNNDVETVQKLRPLAHIDIRDQTLATAVMMCLADVVETTQGDTSAKDFMQCREQGVVSYGNRLHCHWHADPKPRAHFSWGNSHIYRQYFEDYRAFLARPRRICAEMSAEVASGNELFVVSLDLKSFFDGVDTDALLGQLRLLADEHQELFGIQESARTDEAFWHRVERIFDWQWDSESEKFAELITGESKTILPLGLPQGLVASGFLANAYLVPLDRRMVEFVRNGCHRSDGFRIIDYCRYVDDVRLVIESEVRRNGGEQKKLLERIETFFIEQLTWHGEEVGAAPLGLSKDKSEIVPYRSISAQNSISALMAAVQSEVSGTFDMDSLIQAAGGLEGLLWMADQIEGANELPESRLRLATIASPKVDVKDDTVKRFVATRLTQLLRHRLAMTDTEAPIDTGDTLTERVTNGTALAHEFETTARKLIKCWADNPSLVLLLRCGLDLFPHPKLLLPVLEALDTKLYEDEITENVKGGRERKVAEYVLSELFRAGAVETGLGDPARYPEQIDIGGYRADLAAVARRIVSEHKDWPWYLVQQALLFLATVRDHSPSLPETETHRRYADLHRAMLYQEIKGERLLEALPCALVGQQINPTPARFGSWLAEQLGKVRLIKIRKEVIRLVSLHRPDLMEQTLARSKSRSPKWKSYVPQVVLEHAKLPQKATHSKEPPKKSSLLSLISRTDNPFAQENAVLALAQALLKEDGIELSMAGGISVEAIWLECDDWAALNALAEPSVLHIDSERLLNAKPSSATIYETPAWVDEDKAWLYGLGRILRSALTGEFDYTSKRYLVTEEVGGYSGLRSTWFKRRLGLFNSGRGLLDEPGPVSPWLSGFLSTLLQWPGVAFKENPAAEAGEVSSAEELLAVLEKRISTQRILYGSRCKTPFYVVPTDECPDGLNDRKLRVAIVQPLLPHREDIDTKDPLHWTPSVMASHRRHLAEVCRLAYQQLRTWASARVPEDPDARDDKPVVDLILFPELAVHPEHLFHLRTLSDKLKANIFTGLTYLKSDKLGAPINQGLWLIRTKTPDGGRAIQYAWQGKAHPTKGEQTMGVVPYRPHITLVELPVGATSPTRIAAAICYDATDLDLLADLRERSDMFLVAALNQDVETFDNMVAALRFHMYQPVVLANMGEFGGSAAQAPLPKHDKIIAHLHGNRQVAVSIFEVDPAPFKSVAAPKEAHKVKGAPAGYKGRPNK